MPGHIAVFAIFEADAAAIEVGYVIGVAAVSVGNESVGTWQVEDTQRLAYYLINDVVITSVKAGSVEAGKTLVFGGGNQFAIVHTAQRKQLVLLAGGESEDVYMLGKIAAFQVQSLLVAYKERFDKDNFIKNLLLDNLLLVDIYNRAKKLHIDTEAKRVIFIIETSHEKDSVALDNVRNLLGGKSRDFVTAVDEKNIIVVKELADKDGSRELEKMAKEMMEILRAESEDDKIHIAYGTVVNDIKEVSKSYKEAKLALDVGKIFFDEKDIVAYSTLGI